MSSALSDDQVTKLYEDLRRDLEECPASKIRTIAGASGWDLATLPDGYNYDTGYTIRQPILLGIDGYFRTFGPDQQRDCVRHLANELSLFFKTQGEERKVQQTISKHGFGFENGDFVPVDASGKVPA